MRIDAFYRFGKLIYQYRWWIIVCWLLLFLACIPVIPKVMQPFKEIGFTDPNSESARANTEINDKLGYSYNRFIIMYSSKKMQTTNPEFVKEIKTSLAGLDHFPIQHQIIYPSANNKQMSTDKHTAYAVVLLKGKHEIEHSTLEHFKSTIKKTPNLNVRIGGEIIFLDDTKKQTQTDLFNAEYIGGPVAVVTMLIVFESVVAACLPVILGAVCALFILINLFFFGHYISLSVFTVNIALLLGLCLSLDYSLLLINRYRDELARGHHAEKALAITLATAGKSIFFSGVAVFISLSALLLFPVNVLFSVGVGGLAAVSVAVIIAVILLPAILAVLKHRINSLPVKLFKQDVPETKTFVYMFVSEVVKKPRVFFVLCLTFLLSLSYPLLHVKLGISDFHILPKTFESRQVFDTFESKFGESQLAPISVVITTPQKNILTKTNISHLYTYADMILNDPRVSQVTGIVSTKPRLSKQQYQMMYTTAKDSLNPEVKKLLKITTNDDVTVMTVISKYRPNSVNTTELIRMLRHSDPGNDMWVQVTGTSSNTIDVKRTIGHVFPFALLWILGFTYLVFLILMRSIVLPLKAILMTILSLSASYGVLVMVIQFGYLHELLNFEPQNILDISLLIIIFCALFGVSMDYEVFLLTRIKEYYEQTGNTIESIVHGLDRSCRIITSAAIIVIFICFSFMSASILMVKAFGLGIAVAVFVDAFIIRMVLVPATMGLLGRWNWYLPKWLKKVVPKISFDQERHS